MDSNEQDYRLHLGNLNRKEGPFFKFMANRLDKGRFCSHVCDVTIILSIKEFHVTIFEF